MQEIVKRVMTQTLGALRFKGRGLFFAWVVCLLGWVGVSVMPNTYEARAVVYIDTATIIRPLLADLAVDTNVMSEVKMMTEVLLSRPLLERIVRETDLNSRAENEEQLENLINLVRRRILISGGFPRNSWSEENLFTIGFTDTDPDVVFDVVKSLLDVFVERSLGQNKKDSVDAQQFLGEQIDKYEQRLSEAERRLADFKKSNVGLMPSEGQDYYQRYQEALVYLEQTNDEYNKVRRRRDTLQAQLEGEEPTFGLLGSPSDGSGGTDVENAQLEALEAELALMRLDYTDKHPRVVNLRDRIDQLRIRDAAGTPAQPNYTLSTDLVNMNSLDLNPVYQSLKISIGEANAELSALTEQVTTAQEQEAYLRQMIDTMPEVEAQLARLNRDYDVNKAQHTALLKKLESARISDDAEFRNDEGKFRVIESPVVPVNPVSPHRPLFASIVLVAGIGFGGALTYLLNLINPVFNSIENLRESLQLPVLGAVSKFRSEKNEGIARKQNKKFALGVGALVLLWVAVVVFAPTVESFVDVLKGLGVLV